MYDEVARTLEMEQLKKVIPEERFNSLEKQVEDFIKRASNQLLARLGFVVKDVPKGLEYIIVELAIARFRAKNNEGMTTYSQEGESISYKNLIDEYSADISSWLEANGYNDRGGSPAGVATFI